MTCGCCMISVVVNVLVLFLLFPSAVNSTITYRSSVVRGVGEDVVFHWNTTRKIVVVNWGLKNPKRAGFSIVFMSGSHINPALWTEYKGRVSFVGNLTAGHAWFKITNLTISDTNYYSVDIREDIIGGASQFLTTFLKVRGNKY